MASNISDTILVLTMQPLGIPPSGLYPAFVFGTLMYCLILIFNLMVIITIILNRSLHKPMYLLLFNMSINDSMGTTIFFPQLISSIFSPDRAISYPACILLALVVHLYGSGALLILTAMVFDRYVAICWPLRYYTVMSHDNTVRIVVCMWLTDCIFIGILLALLSRLSVCRTVVVDMYCNNPSLVKLVCDDVTVSNYYGLFITVLFQGTALITMVFTYCHILFTCLKIRQSDVKAKAIQTCASHLVVFIFLEFNTLFVLISHRFEQTSPYLRRAFGVSVMIFPPFVNPLIYGLKMKDIRDKVFKFFLRKVSPTCEVRTQVRI